MIKIKNDWFLIKAERAEFKENGNVYIIAYYSNGLEERYRRFITGSSIPTMIDYEQGTTLF
jgi:hypothetical protein